jgi:PAS domain S-box-containing protein
VQSDQTTAQEPWLPDPRLLDGMDHGIVVTDRQLRILYVNDSSLVELGFRRESLRGVRVTDVLFPDSDVEAVERLLGRVLSDDRWSGDLQVKHVDGTVHSKPTTLLPVWSTGEVCGAMLMLPGLSRTAATEIAARRVAEQLTRLAKVTSELMLAENVIDVTKVVTEHAAFASGATRAALSVLLEDGTVSLLGLHGAEPEIAERYASVPLSARVPTADCIRSGERIIMTGREEIEANYPDVEGMPEIDRTTVTLPLRISGRTIGAAWLSFPGIRKFASQELEYFNVLADTIAQALDRVNALAEAADQRTKLRFLADASAELAKNLDYQSTLTRVAYLAVPDYADWCSIQLLEEGQLRTIAVAHTDPAKVDLALDLQRRFPPDPDAQTGAYQVLRTGQPELLPEISDDLLEASVDDPELLRLARELNLRSALTVPLKARDRVMGVITWVAGDGGRRFGPSDVTFGEDLARRAAVAIDNAQLHSELREAAVRLQRAVLPDRLAQVPGWDISALYLPAGRTEVGGDFYDVITLDDGRLVMFVGDVMGRGVKAAAAMAQMRSAIRAYLAIDADPLAVLEKLDVLFRQFDMAQLVTLVYTVIDARKNEICLCNAGHPPPVLLRADGTREQLPDPDGVPLGVGAGTRAPVRVPFFAGDALLAFTDGLIERRTEDIDAGQRRLMDALATIAGHPGEGLDSAVLELVEAVRDHTRDDDVAVVAVRRG